MTDANEIKESLEKIINNKWNEWYSKSEREPWAYQAFSQGFRSGMEYYEAVNLKIELFPKGNYLRVDGTIGSLYQECAETFPQNGSRDIPSDEL